MKTNSHVLTLILICALILGACATAISTPETQPPEPTATVVPFPTPRPEKLISQLKPVKVSASWILDPPENAVDGNLNNWWGAGGPVPQWIEVDLEGIYSISKIRIINEGPTGLAAYQVYGRGPDNASQLLHVFDGNKSNNQRLEFSPEEPWEDVCVIRIEMNYGVGWVGLREVQVYSREDPKPLPSLTEDTTPPFIAGIDSADLEVINADNAVFMKELALLGRGPINDLAWSPDGGSLAVASPVGIWLYDPNNLEKSPMLLEGHKRDVLTAVFSPDGETVFSGSQDGTVKLWDAATGELKRTMHLWDDFRYEVDKPSRDPEVWSIAFSPDSKLMAAGTMDGNLQLWDLSTGRQLTSLQGHTRLIYNLAFSSDNALLASNSVDGTIIVWDVKTGDQRFSLTAETSEQRLVFSPDGKILAIAYGGADTPIELYDTDSGEKIDELSGHNTVISLSYTPVGLVTNNMAGELQFWDAETEVSRVISSNAGWIIKMAVSPDGSTLAVGDWHGVLEIWDITSDRPSEVQIGHTRPISSIAFSPDGKYLASGTEDGVIWVWDIRTNALEKAMLGHAGRVTSVAYSPDGTLLASSSLDRTVRLWDASTGSQVSLLQGHTQYIRCIAFSPDGMLVASGSADKTVRLWDVATGEELAVLTGFAGEVQSVAFSPDGAWLVTAVQDSTIRLWDVVTGKEAGIIGNHLSPEMSVAFSPDGLLVASGSGDHWLHVWDWDVVSGVAAGGNHFPSIGHPGWVMSVAFSPDGKILASANTFTASIWVAPGEIHLYSADTGYPYVLLRGHTKRVTSIAFSPDGKLLASGSADGSVRLWGVPGDGSVSEVSHTSTSTPTASAPTPEPVDRDLFIGEWTAIDLHDGSNMTLTIKRNDDGSYSITLIDDGSTGCGVDSDGKPKVGIEVVLTASAIRNTLYGTSTSVTCLSTPSSPLNVTINQNFEYRAETDTLWDDANRAIWNRK